MTPSDVFQISSTLVLPMWLLMIVLPKWKVTRWLIDYKLIPILLSIIYAIYILKSMAAGNGLDFGSLETVMALFTKEEAVLAGWVHYLAFDLLVGMWILNRNIDLKINHLLIIPCLIGCFMLGPIGFLLFIIIRTIKTSLK